MSVMVEFQRLFEDLHVVLAFRSNSGWLQSKPLDNVAGSVNDVVAVDIPCWPVCHVVSTGKIRIFALQMRSYFARHYSIDSHSCKSINEIIKSNK